MFPWLIISLSLAPIVAAFCSLNFVGPEARPLKTTGLEYVFGSGGVCVCVDLLFEDVYRCLVGFELLVLEEYLPPQLERGGQEGVVTEVTLKQETHHQTLAKHHLGERGTLTGHERRGTKQKNIVS